MHERRDVKRSLTACPDADIEKTNLSLILGGFANAAVLITELVAPESTMKDTGSPSITIVYCGKFELAFVYIE